jgi:hypothetical protein
VEEPYIYTGQSDVPTDITHVKVVDPSVKVIGEESFCDCNQLINVELCEGLERIDEWAFSGCTSLTSIIIPSTVKVIGKDAFSGCSQLRSVELNEGLECIEGWAFQGCKSLDQIIIPCTVKKIGIGVFCECSQLRNVQLLCEGLERIEFRVFGFCTLLRRITIPPTVKEIGVQAFKGCNQLVHVELCDGLTRIDHRAFYDCSSLWHIRIPVTVRYIAEDAFEDCDSLETIEFCDAMEQFVNEALLHWWNFGTSEASLRTFCFLARHNILARLGTLRAQSLKENIHNMLQRIPKEKKNVNYFDSIEARLAKYEYLQEVAPFLELALWKAKITEQQSNGNLINDDTKMLCRIDSISMFAIFFPNVLSFLFRE